MIDESIIKDAVSKLVREYNPIEIYLFGSFAWGKPDENSDLDLIIVLRESDEKPYKRSVRALKALRDIKVAKDVLVYTEKEFNSLSSDASSLCHKVVNEGVKVYEAARSLAN